MIWINRDQAAAMTTEELFKVRESIAGNLAAPAAFRSNITLDFEKTCVIQTIENELQDRGAIEFKDRLF